MSNYIAVYGPSGPLYLLKTNKLNQWWVINGDWLLVLDEISIPELPEYKIVMDNFGAYSHQQACATIEMLYEESLPYKTLCSHNVNPFNEEYDDIIHLQKQNAYQVELPDAIIEDKVIDFKLSTPTIDLGMGGSIISEKNTLYKNSSNVTNEKAEAFCKHFEIDCNEIEMNLAKELIARSYPMENIMPTINTNIVTTKTVHFVNDQDVESMTSDQLINNIAQLEASIEKLNEIKIKSKFVTKTITEQETTLNIVVEHLDARS